VNAKSPLSEYLRSKKAGDETIAKVFVSGADGCKVGLDAKTEHWTHKGMPKHEVPMTGATWIGTVKVDDSTGLNLSKWECRFSMAASRSVPLSLAYASTNYAREVLDIQK
jgi:hypothetical protein